MQSETGTVSGAIRRWASGLVFACMLAPTLATATGDEPPSPPIAGNDVRQIPNGHDATEATSSTWSGSRPSWQDNATRLTQDEEAFSPDVEINGDRWSVGLAIALAKQYASQIAAERQEDVPDDSVIERATAGLANVETALAQKLRTIADKLDDPAGFSVDWGTRQYLNRVNESFFPLQVAAARRDNPDFNVLYDEEIDNVSVGLNKLLERQETAAIRRQSIVELGGHHLALDVYFDGTEGLASVVILDSTLGSVAAIEENLSFSLPADFHLAVTHYATRQQAVCLGCRQFALEAARAMRNMDIHDAPLGQLLAAIEAPRTSDQDVGVRLFDQIDPQAVADGPNATVERASLTRRLGELPPSLFSLTNRERSWLAYRQAREAYLADRPAEERDAGLAELDREHTAISQRLVGRASQSHENTINPWNLAIDDARREGIERLAQRFENRNGSEVMQSYADAAEEVLSSPSARAAGERQRGRLEAMRDRRSGLPDRATGVATDETHDKAIVAVFGTNAVADRVLDEVVADRDDLSSSAESAMEHEVTDDAAHDEQVTVEELVRRFEALTNRDRPQQRRERDERQRLAEVAE